MDSIAQRLKAYIETHLFDPGDSGCETVLDQLFQAYQESHESDPPDIRDGWDICRWKIIMPYSTSAVASAQPMSIKLFWMVCSMAHN